jgi:phage shock protein C
MQPRLTRSKQEKMIAGVCGGLGEYFAIDPVIVRLIFVLGTLTTGIGLLVYPILWLVMPSGGSGPAAAGAEAWRQRAESAGQEAAQFGRTLEREAQEVWRTVAGQVRGPGAPGTPGAPYGGASTGDTVNLYGDPMAGTQISVPPQRPRKRFGWAGVVLIGVGLMMLAEFFHIPTHLVFPMLLIAAGIAMLARRG